MMKLDIKKSYDNINRDFLKSVLENFDFAKGWCN